MLGMSLPAFTLFHVALSLIGIACGFVVLADLRGSRLRPRWTAVFLITTILTSVTGFLFPVVRLLPSHVVGVISLAVLAVAVFALYVRKLAGPWRWIYVASAVAALYLNVFVLVVQQFAKTPALNEWAPTQSELPFVLSQALVLAAFAALFVGAVRRFMPERSQG